MNKDSENVVVATQPSLSALLLKRGLSLFTVSGPRIHYPKAAKKEGIASILSVPISIHGKVIGNLRVYTAQPNKANSPKL